MKNHMPKMLEIKDIPLADIVVDRKQSSNYHRKTNIDELALVIKKNGLLKPIVVCLSDQPGKYKVLLGLHYYIAHKMLNKKKITAFVYKKKVNEKEAAEISFLESYPTKLLKSSDLRRSVLVADRNRIRPCDSEAEYWAEYLEEEKDFIIDDGPSRKKDI